MYTPISAPARRMPHRFLMALAVLAGLTVLMSSPAGAGYYPPAHSDAAYFHDSLAPYGTWTHHASYGAVWYPHGVAHGWRPYTQGRWVWDDSYGWTWASAFAWGWAPFHYGNWVWDTAFGWIWVPRRIWAPAWVTWRYSDSYIGWAPIGYGANWWSYSPGWNYGGWNYVHRHHFGAPVIHHHVIVVKQYQTIYHNTRHWAPPRNTHNRIAHRGFDRNFVERGSRYKVDRVHARPDHWQRNDHRSGSSDRNVWHDNGRDDARHVVPERRADGRREQQWSERSDGQRGMPNEYRREERYSDQQWRGQEQQRTRQMQTQPRPSHPQAQPQRQRQAQEQQRPRQMQAQQRPPQAQAQPQRQRQALEQQRSRQMQAQQRPPQAQEQLRQQQMQRRQVQAPQHPQARGREPQMQRQAQTAQRQAQTPPPRIQSQRAPQQEQRQPQQRYEQRAERRDGSCDGAREGGRSWR